MLPQITSILSTVDTSDESEAVIVKFINLINPAFSGQEFLTENKSNFNCQQEVCTNLVSNGGGSFNKEQNVRLRTATSDAYGLPTEKLFKEQVQAKIPQDANLRVEPTSAPRDVTDSELYSFVQEKYRYYDRVDGEYKGQYHDQKVFQAAAEKFGGNANDLESRYQKYSLKVECPSCSF